MLTERDQKVIDFLVEFKAARTSVIVQLFYTSYRVAMRRLAALANDKELKRERDSDKGEYIYYVKKPKHLRHALILTDVYALLARQVDIHSFIIEPTIEDVRPDALVDYEDSGKKKLAFIEVELSNKGFDMAKYEHLYNSGAWQAHFPVFPKIIAVTNKKMPETFLAVDVLPTSIKK